MAEIFTQPYTLQLRSFCVGRGVYLRWLSPLGNWEGWLFDGDIDTSTTPAAGSVFRPETGPAQLLSRGSVHKALYRAGNLTPAQHATLTTLLDSPQVYIQGVDGRLTPVLVDAAPAGRTSADSRPTFDIEVELGTTNPLTRV